MNRPIVPADAHILVEVGASRPTETGFDPFGPYEVLWVVTNGKVQRNFLRVTRRKSGIYVASGDRNQMHTSYHENGHMHWKLDSGETVNLDPNPALPDIPKPVLIQSATTVITDEVLDRWQLPEYSDQPVDRVVYLDNRMLPEAIYYHVWAMPPFRHGEVPLLANHPAQIHVCTHTNPWIQVVIYEQGERSLSRMTGRGDR